MNVFCGIDSVEIERIKNSLSNDKFLKRVYSQKEQALFALKKGKSYYQSIAANFAAKEAFSKALKTGVRGFELNEVSILRDEMGAPYIELEGKAKECALGYEFSVSLTHTDTLASAVVIAKKGK